MPISSRMLRTIVAACMVAAIAVCFLVTVAPGAHTPVTSDHSRLVSVLVRLVAPLGDTAAAAARVSILLPATAYDYPQRSERPDVGMLLATGSRTHGHGSDCRFTSPLRI